ncbi:MAG: DUF1178 family protein [Deltaproteobacteria bacterium]|nr:DUF1178 family protein [Deltaproteobacteria bacterium]MBW2200150.1 DUF1178 family protein [Deltaproteobacteria bacterium]
MIAYDLQCANGHIFEGWFEDGQAYEAQQKKNLIACPVCNDTSINRIPSTFAIKTSQVSISPQDRLTDLEKFGKQIIDYVKKSFDDVGTEFAKEALKIHYGVSEPKNIRGVSTKQEEETLKQEGVKFFKIPMPTPPDTDA